MRQVQLASHMPPAVRTQLADSPRRPFLVIHPAALPRLWSEGMPALVPVTTSAEMELVLRMRRAGLAHVYPLLDTRAELSTEAVDTFFVLESGTLEPEDVLAVDFQGRQSEVLMRKSDQHHTIFLTNQCNSRCLMCSQPPTNHDDSWRTREAQTVAQLLTWSPPVFGFTGGEPLLLGHGLRDILSHFQLWHPGSRLEVLSNARLAGDDALAKSLFDGLEGTSWMVPLYGHAPFLHDHVVQAEGAFDQTIAGLLNLQRYKQPIQLRVVLVQPVLEVLPQLCTFIASNLPFVREVALMGCEPIGFAMANQDECRLDLRDWSLELRGGVRALSRGQVPVVLMNLPLCSIDQQLWPLAHRSISDWKNVFAPECEGCSVKDRCCGLFAWYDRGWAPTTLRPISNENLCDRVPG
jgi:His-Xaa-Ser system radical SAM maturase HxsC